MHQQDEYVNHLLDQLHYRLSADDSPGRQGKDLGAQTSPAVKALKRAASRYMHASTHRDSGSTNPLAELHELYELSQQASVPQEAAHFSAERFTSKTLAVLIGITGIVPAAAGVLAPQVLGACPLMYPGRLLIEDLLVRRAFGADPRRLETEDPPALNLFVLAPLMYLIYAIMVCPKRTPFLGHAPHP